MPRKKSTEPSASPNILTITPEVVADLAEQIRKAKTRAEIDHLEQIAKLMSAIAEDNPRPFAAFYQIIHGNEIPAHCLEWVGQVSKAQAEGRAARRLSSAQASTPAGRAASTRPAAWCSMTSTMRRTASRIRNAMVWS